MKKHKNILLMIPVVLGASSCSLLTEVTDTVDKYGTLKEIYDVGMNPTPINQMPTDGIVHYRGFSTAVKPEDIWEAKADENSLNIIKRVKRERLEKVDLTATFRDRKLTGAVGNIHVNAQITGNTAGQIGDIEMKGTFHGEAAKSITGYVIDKSSAYNPRAAVFGALKQPN